ncbi:MAG: carbohydrate kinase [Dehalococcoidia bacterium]|nr:carbohydrate kinase [Dehalococcoidia bacterium]
MKPLIIGIGELLWDMLPQGKQLGGAPANFAYHAQELGGKSMVVSCVGADDDGRQILHRFDTLSLNYNFISIDTDHPTGVIDIKIDTQGKPTYTIHENVAWDFIPQTPRSVELAEKADCICFGTLAQRSEVSQSTIQAFLKQASKAPVRVFDINLRQSFFSREVIEASLVLSNILKLNDEEMAIIAPMFSLQGSEPALLAELARRYHLRLIALTRGKNGSVLYSNGRTSIHPGYRVEVADTVGAGDAFTAALAIGILEEHDMDAINDHANRVAAYVCSQPGATPRLPAELRLIS